MTIEYKDSKRIISSPAEYKIHTFNADSTFTLSSGSGNINYVIIGGGAGGGGASYNSDAGGGGAGQYKTGTLAISSARGYTIDVGAGGAGGIASTNNAGNNGSNGSYSRFDDGGAEQIQSDGGGLGAGVSGQNGNSGGSGGGGAGQSVSVGGTGGAANGTGTNAGGDANVRDGGGGGGAGGAGANGVDGTGVGHGGIGVVNPLSGSTSGVLSGSSYYFAAGGGAGRANGGTGGGGVGSQGSGALPVSGAGVANTGSGGGGAHENNDAGGAGGTGVIIISYVDDGSITATGGTITIGGSAPQSKPTDVQDNSILIEKDTAKRFWFDAESDNTPTFEDDFSSDTWTGCKNNACDSGAPTTVTISGGDLSAVSVNVASDDRMVKALGLTLSNTAWIYQFETNVSSTGTHTGLVGLVSSGGNMNNTSILCDYNGSNKIIMREYNSGLTEMGSGISISTGTQYYVTVIRTSLTGLTLEVRTGSHTGTLVGSESGTITGATGLTHVQSGAYGRGSGTATYDIDNIKIYNGVTSVTTPATWTWENYFSATRGVFGGGTIGAPTNEVNVMDYITIATTGNATDFGDLTVAKQGGAGVSSQTRGVFGGGHLAGASNVMDYITIASTGNATDFGDLTLARYSLAGVSSSTRGVFGGGSSGSVSDVMDYITISTTGNATDFGNLTVGRDQLAGVSSDTRGVFGGADGSNVMDYITIATTGNATDFGNLTVARGYFGGVSSDTRGVFGGGNGASNVMDYITIDTTGNATDFGDLTLARYYITGVSSLTRGVFGGGSTGSMVNTIDYITIATTGNATDFGDLTVTRQQAGGVQGS